MKNLLTILCVFALSILLVIVGCKKESSSDIGGDQSTIGEVGNTFSVTSSNGFSNVSMVVTKLEGGVSTIRVTGTITDPAIKQLAATIPNFDFGSYDPATGDFTGDLKMKFTKDGIADLLNVAGRSFTLVKFDGDVGDTYTCEKAAGGTFTRTVTAKSNEDDFPYGYYYIKTMTIEEPGRNAAIKKIIYRTNHRFGLVHATVVLQDGSEISSYLYSQAEN
jgi:hypothetical protein